MVGQEIRLMESELEDYMDDMLAAGYTQESEKDVEVYRITRYLCDGKAIIDDQVIAGRHIPVVPAYGEHAFIKGEEHWEGITNLARDPQMLRDFQLSYLTDLFTRSPGQKPIFFPEQVAGFEDMYSVAGPDSNYPYLLQNRKSGDGTDLPVGPVGLLPDRPIPQALAASIELTRQAITDVANSGNTQDIADPDLSGKAVLALQARLDMQSMVFQEHMKHAKRRDGEVWASMASEIYDTPRKVKIVMPDGNTKQLPSWTR